MKKDKKKDILKKFNEMLRMQDGLNDYLKKEFSRLLNSGGIDTDEHEFNFIIPKTILYVALLNAANQYRPLSDEALKDARNLLHF